MGAITTDFKGVEELRARQSEIKAELERIDNEYRGQALPDEDRTSWNELNAEWDELEAQANELITREERMLELARDPQNPDDPDDGPPFQMRRSSATRTADIWDLTTIRSP